MLESVAHPTGFEPVTSAFGGQRNRTGQIFLNNQIFDSHIRGMFRAF